MSANTGTITAPKAATEQTTKLNITGSEAVLKALIAENVKTIFGYPGGAIMPIYDALFDYENELEHILVRHEQGAIHAAQGFARTSGKVGVVFATSGPGATNLVTGLADAQIDSTPLVSFFGLVFAFLLGFVVFLVFVVLFFFVCFCVFLVFFFCFVFVCLLRAT